MEAAPFESAAIERFEGVGAWRAEAPDLVASVLRRWRLTPHDAFVGGVSGSVLAVTRADGSSAVLKLGFPHEESIWEAVELQALAPELAPRILDQDAWTWALLLEPVRLGTPLNRAPLPTDEALRIGARTARALHEVAAPPGIPTLLAGMTSYADGARSRLPQQAAQLDRMGVLELVSESIELLARLAADPVPPRLLHGDFNPGNVLQSDQGWRVVDPNPLVGDPAYDLWPLVSQLGAAAGPDDAGRLARRLRVAAETSGIDEERAALWGRARSGLDVSWYVADREIDAAEAAARSVRAWATVAGV